MEQLNGDEARKMYVTPELTLYGSIADLTRGNAGSGNDAGPHTRKILPIG
jgi:hypothetical protein